MNFVFERYRFRDEDHGENMVKCTDVNYSTIKRFSTSPFSSMLIRHARTFENFDNYDLSQVKHSLKPDDFDQYIIATSVNHHPYDWCGPDQFNIGHRNDRPNVENLFWHLNEKYLHDLRIGKAFLLLDQCHEGYQTDWLWDWFHNSCHEYSVNPRQIIFLTGNMRVEEDYEEWCKEKNPYFRIKPIPYPTFEAMICLAARNKGLKTLPSFYDHVTYKKMWPERIKAYNLLQKRPRAHRMWMFKEIVNNGLLEHGINSMNPLDYNNTYFEGKLMDPKDYATCSRYLPMLPPNVPYNPLEVEEFGHEDSGKYQLFFNEKVCLDSYMSVISEASFGDSERTCFISEKTFKPIACYHPFIVFGNKHSLAVLREMGYKTFHPFIDESYDSKSSWQRLSAITEAIWKVKSIPVDQRLDWYMGMEEILEHNYNKLKCAKLSAPQAVLILDQYLKDMKNVP
jgi:hypothetical protein